MSDDRLYSSAQLLGALSKTLKRKVEHHHVRWLFDRGDLEAVAGDLARPNDKRRVRIVAARLVYTRANAQHALASLKALPERRNREDVQTGGPRCEQVSS